MAAEVPQAEQEEVAGWWAKLQASGTVAEELKPRWDELRDALAGKFPRVVPVSKAESLSIEAGKGGWTDQIETNFVLRGCNDISAQVGDGAWVMRYPRGGDVDDDAVTEVETLIEKVVEQGDAVHEFAQTVPDVVTMGQTITWVGVGRDIVDPAVLEGLNTDPADLIVQASQGIPVKPLPGMNHLELAKAALDFTADPHQQMRLTGQQADTVRNLAVEAGKMHDAEAELDPGWMYTFGDVWYARTPYYSFCRIDPCCTDKKYARWMARRLVMTMDEAKGLTAFKAKARKELAPSEIGKDVGYFPEFSEGIDQHTRDDLKARADIWEIWDRDTAKVHYISRGYKGYLEVDSRYPHNDENGKSIFADWFPCEFGTPRLNNLEKPKRVLGEPVASAMFPKQLEYIKLESAHLAGVKKAARVIAMDKAVDDDTRDAIERGVDGTTVTRPETLKEGDKVFETLDFGKTPVEYMAGMMYLKGEIARDFDMSGPAMTGQNVTPTLGQEEMAASGAEAGRNGLVARLERSAGRICDMTIALIRRYYSVQKVTTLMGPSFTTPKTDPATGQPAAPSLWDQFRTSSLCGDRVNVQFGPRGRGKDLATVKVLTDFAAYLNTRLDPMGFPLYDVKPVDERIARMIDAGRLKDYVPSPAEIQMRVQMQLAQQQGGQPGGGPPGGGGPPSNGKVAPGGGRTDGHTANGQRGPPPSPSAQTRHEGPPDRGDMETKVRRTGFP